MIGGGRCAEKHNPSETEGWIMDVSVHTDVCIKHLDRHQNN